jgi:TRAP-type mannitol/chloroaromatic compound transport system permease large subunit
VLIPPLALIFLVLGTIFLGVATPTEGGAMGATGALIMALAGGACRGRCSAGDGHDASCRRSSCSS